MFLGDEGLDEEVVLLADHVRNALRDRRSPYHNDESPDGVVEEDDGRGDEHCESHEPVELGEYR